MQTTLLGLAIAFIIALLAALIGPYVIDWNQFRPQFEAEASRILGTPVRVGGNLDARLLPVPSLRLRQVQVGGPNDLGKVRADKLDIELSLGSLLRGEVRATELTINGAALDLGLDDNGRIDWPAATGTYNFGSLAIDRVNVTGRVALHDAASRSTIELNDIAFSGDVRALAGAIRGDGNFMLSGVRYPFRVSSTPGTGNVGTRVHLTIDPAERPLMIDLDGLLTFEQRSPRFDGALVVARPAQPKDTAEPRAPPWRVAAKLKAAPTIANLDQIEASYGPDDATLKVAGTAAIRWGDKPSWQATLAAKTIDADRLIGTSATPLSLLLAAVHDRIPDVVPTVAGRLTLAADQVMIAGRPVQGIVMEASTDAHNWRLDRFEATAPGSTRITLAGAAAPASGPGFAGALTLDSAEPDVFAGWLQARTDIAPRAQKPLRLQGKLTVAPDRVVLDAMSGEIDASAIDGRLALVFPDAGPSRADVRIKADRLDLDSVATLVRSLAGPDATWPDEAQVSLDIGRAVSAGQEMRPFGVDLQYGPRTVALKRLRVGEASGVMLDGTGAFDRSSSTGKFDLGASSASMSQVSALVAPFAPDFAARLAAMPATPGQLKLKLGFEIAQNPAQADRANLTTTLTLNGPQVSGSASITAAPQLAAMRALNIDALRATDVAVTARLSTPQARTLIALLGLDQTLSAQDGAAQLDVTSTGAWNAPLHLSGKLSAPSIDADVRGTAEPFAEPRKATLDLAIRRANFAPLLALKVGDPRTQLSAVTARIGIAGDRIAFDGLDGTIGGARLRGKLALTLAEPKSIDGEVGLDSLELAPLFNLAIGNTGASPTEPLGRGLVQGWHGKLGFQALRGGLPGGIELRPVSGTIKADGQSLVFDAIKGKIGGGDVSADIDVRPGLSGLAINARLQTTEFDGAALRYQNLSLPGRASLKMVLTSQGRSAEALAGALSGDGLVTLTDAKIAGLDPRAFDVAVRASDAGQATDDARLTQLMQTALNAGALTVGSAQIGVAIKDGSIRVGATTLDGDGARAIVSGGYDIAADQMDIRATLTSTTVGSGSSRPEVRLFAAGTPDKLSKTLDVASLSTWLAVRAIDRETRRLDQLERAPLREPAASPRAPDVAPPPSEPAPVALPRPAPIRPRVEPPKPAAAASPPRASVQVAPLPPAIEVRPAPGAVPRPQRPRGPLVLTPQPGMVQ